MQKDAQLATTTPGTSSKCFALARRYWMQSQPEAAYEALSSILAEHDDHYEARALRLQVGRVLKRKETEEDAHKLLTLGPDAGLAYLYFGQSMMAKGKQADAIGLFEKAQRRVASNDPHRREIQQLLHTLHRTEINILIRLPPDILCLVFSFLPFAARLRCAAVSRIWRHALTTVSILWRDLDLTSDDAEDDGVIVALERSARWAEGEIRSLRIALSAKVLRALARQDLHHLHHVDFTPPGRRMIEERSLVQTMQIIAAPWHHVSVSGRTIPIGAFTAALCLHCPRIKSLVIERGALMDTVDNVDTDATIDSLRTLILLQSYDTEASDIQNLLRICPKITTLHIDACVAFESRKTWEHMAQLTQLEHLALTSTEPDLMHGPGFIRYIKKHPLKSLDLNYCELEKDTLCQLAGAMRAGILRWGLTSSYAMDDPEDRQRFRSHLRILEEESDTDG